MFILAPGNPAVKDFARDRLHKERIIVLCQGEVIADGTRDEIFGDMEVVKKSGIRPPEIFTLGQEIQSDAFCYTVDEFVQGFGGN